jgi:enoyl-CoA hydratase
MKFENLLVEQKKQVLEIVINRPDKLNALNRKTISEIGDAIRAAQANDDIRVIILTGSGNKAFVAGADISEFQLYSVKEGTELAQEGQEIFNLIENSEKLIIAAVNGFALGGGCELAMACHMRIAASNAKFGQPEVKLGLIPGYGGTQRLASLVGKTKAMELLVTADMINANEALALGLVNYITEHGNLMEKCYQIAEKISEQAPLAVSAIIKCVNANYDKNKNGFDTEITEFGKCFGTNDFKEGALAFLEKRKADFKGN